jgi:hypothetical protein
MQDLYVLGYYGRTLSGVDPDTPDFHDFRDLEIEVVCCHEQAQDGKMWERWRLRTNNQNLADKSKLRQLDRILASHTNGGTADDAPDISEEYLRSPERR